MIIDLWYGDSIKSIDKIDCFFSDFDCMYRGNLYKQGRIVGDYSTRNSIEIENRFSRLFKEGKK